MANLLWSNVIDGAQRAYPMLSDADGLVLAKEVLIEVLASMQVETGEEDVNITDGTREYELAYDPQIIGDVVVYYRTAVDAATRLTPVSVDWMDGFRDNWRTTADTGTPSMFYLRAPTSAALTTQGKLVIGLDPIPDTTTAAGYPKLTIYGVEYEEPLATSDVPQAIPNVRVLIEGIKRNYAMDRDPAKYQLYKSTFEDELAKCQSLINRQAKDLDAPIVYPTWMNTTKIV